MAIKVGINGFGRIGRVALRSMVERLQESVDRGMWENPDPELINQLHELYLEVEGDLEE